MDPPSPSAASSGCKDSAAGARSSGSKDSAAGRVLTTGAGGASAEAEAHDDAKAPGKAPGQTTQTGLLYNRKGGPCLRPSQNTGRITWDEAAIAEHDKLRGTRQKIDEPDTPFVRSPQNVSDDEEAPAAVSLPTEALRSLQLGTSDPQLATSPTGDVTPQALASRLETWLHSGSKHDEREEETGRTSSASSRSSSKQAASEGSARFSLAEDSGALASPKPSSDRFKALRSQHYNEVSALKAFRRKTSDGDSSQPDSDTSDENVRAKINKKKNITQSTSEAGETSRPRPTAQVAPADSAGSRSSSAQLADSTLPGSGAIEFQVPGLEVVQPGDSSQAGADAADWKKKRNAHYNEMAAAMRSMPPPSDDEDDDDDAEAGEASTGGALK